MTASTAAADGPAWIRSLFASIDRRDAEAFGTFVTPDAQFRFGNAPAVHGRDAIVAAVGGFFEAIAGLRHDIDLTIRSDDHVVCRGTVTYTRHDGSQVTLPFADVFAVVGEQIADYRIYMDLAPLWAGDDG